MARIAVVECGFDDIDDPRNYFRDCLRPLIPDQYQGSFQQGIDFTFPFVWRWKQLAYDFQITWSDDTSEASISASGTALASWLYSAAVPDESSIACQTEFSYAIGGLGTPDGTEMQFQMQLGDFDEIGQVFNFGVRGGFTAFAQPSPTVSFGFPFVGQPSGVVCTVLGNDVPMFDVVGRATGSVTIGIAGEDGYWAYDNGLTGPTDGPIWDHNTGLQLISPVPAGL